MAAVCICLATGVCAGSVTLAPGPWVMKGVCSSCALLLQISRAKSLRWSQIARVSWPGLCGPGTSPWSANTSLHALRKCHAAVRQTLFHPFNLIGCQGIVKFTPSKLMRKEGRKESLQHPWQPTRKEGRKFTHPWQPSRLNVWNSVCSLLHSLCSTCCTKLKNLVNHQSAALQTSPRWQSKQGRALCMSTTTVIKSSSTQEKPPSGRALEMLQARPPADCDLLKGSLDKTP